MQSGFFIITLGVELFILVGYLFYLVFRKYADKDDKELMLKWMIRLIGALTAGLIVSVALVATRMPALDLLLSVILLALDLMALTVLFLDKGKIAREGLIVEEA